MNGAQDAILLRGLSAVYEGESVPAIRDIDMSVASGDFICVVGPNGAGKTTLLEVINGILPHTSGEGTALGLSISENGDRIRKRIGYVIQNFEIDPLSPFLCRNVVMSGRAGMIGLLRFPAKHDWDVVNRALSLVGMESYASRPVGKLSGGEFQKILIARAIAQEPEVYLLDEPFSNLDIKARGDVDRLICELNRGGSTILMVSHDVGSIPLSCTRMILMDRGRIVAEGPRNEMLQTGEISDLLRCRGSEP
ncbi:MAG: metal ABC transporter ATP-binding protein [Methanobacteriota archaeon]|nr:MAG: metal ABC transporter ATP-binding protein [Euryarchaeota archaeon]